MVLFGGQRLKVQIHISWTYLCLKCSIWGVGVGVGEQPDPPNQALNPPLDLSKCHESLSDIRSAAICSSFEQLFSLVL